MSFGGYHGWRRYVPVAQRKNQAARKIAALRKRGRAVDPVIIEARKIAHTFWGKAWCDNLESYSDYANRLPRGRTYVRNGSVIDLQIGPGQVTALVSGSSIYQVDIAMRPAARAQWRALAKRCAGKFDSMVELLQGRLSRGVMAILASRKTGLFPAPREISLECSCPDWATMCKHVSAVLYGVGARLDHSPELLFVLRGVDPTDLVAQVSAGGSLGEVTGDAKGEILEASGLSDIFGIDFEDEPPSRPAVTARRKRSGAKIRPSRAGKKPSTKGGSRVERPATSRRTGSKASVSRGARASVLETRSRRAKSSGEKVSGKKGSARAASSRKAERRARSGGSKRRSREVTARELIELGVARSTIQNWLSSGVLVRTAKRGVYRRTATTEERIKRVLRKRRR
jgi:uncharacterized Zn finger protein